MCQNDALDRQHGPDAKLCVCVCVCVCVDVWVDVQSLDTQSVFEKCCTLLRFGSKIPWGSNQIKITTKCTLHVFDLQNPFQMIQALHLLQN